MKTAHIRKIVVAQRLNHVAQRNKTSDLAPSGRKPSPDDPCCM